MSAQEPRSLWENLVVRNVFSVATWLWLVLDCASHFNLESDRVWKYILVKKGFPPLILLVYILSRYGGLVGQTVNLVWTIVMLCKLSNTAEHCLRWFNYQSAVIQILYAAVQYVLILRVSALYFNANIAIAFLSLVWVFERVAVAYIGEKIFQALKFNGTCLVDQTPFKPVLFMMSTFISVQLIIWGMTFVRHIELKRPQTLIARRVLRNGALVCASLVAFFFVVVPYSMLVHVLTHNMFGFFLTLLSNLGSKIILDLRIVDEEVRATSRPSGTLTWCLDTLDSDESSASHSLDQGHLSSPSV